MPGRIEAPPPSRARGDRSCFGNQRVAVRSPKARHPSKPSSKVQNSTSGAAHVAPAWRTGSGCCGPDQSSARLLRDRAIRSLAPRDVAHQRSTCISRFGGPFLNTFFRLLHHLTPRNNPPRSAVARPSSSRRCRQGQLQALSREFARTKATADR